MSSDSEMPALPAHEVVEPPAPFNAPVEVKRKEVLQVFKTSKEPNRKKEKEKRAYLANDVLKSFLFGNKVLLDCGHKVTFGHHWANSVVIFPGENGIEIQCTECWQ